MKTTKLLLIVTLLHSLLTGLLLPESVAAEVNDGSNTCFVVADRYIAEGGVEENAQDTLAYLNIQTGDSQSVNGQIPNMSTNFVEAIAFAPGGVQLYAADANRLGTVELTTGDFTPVSGTFGAGRGRVAGVIETVKFADIDGMTFHPITGELWGVHVTVTGLDLLFKIDKTTGLFIANSFADPLDPGQSVDFVEIAPVGTMEDTYDVAIDPVDGTMYGIMTRNGGPGALVIIDPTNGNTTSVGTLTRAAADGGIDNMDGSAFDNGGQLYGTTGGDGKDKNSLWAIDKQTGITTLIGEYKSGLTDIESLDCLSGSTSIVIQATLDGADASSPSSAVRLQAGEALSWNYLIRNTGILPLSNVTVIDNNGTPDNASDDHTVCQGFALEPGQSNHDIGIACESSGTAWVGPLAHTTRVSAQDAVGNTFSADALTHYNAYEGTTVGDRVWHDLNGNGIQDAIEQDAGVDGVLIALNTDTDKQVSTTLSSDGGFYSFHNLQPGTYYLEFTLPTGYGFSQPSRGTEPSKDSDVQPGSAVGRTPLFTLVDGEANLDIDAGLTGRGEPSSIAGYAWEDLNGDGIQNDGDPAMVAIAGTEITLYRRNGADFVAVGTTTTAADGSYKYENLEAGVYRIGAAVPNGYDALSRANQGVSNDLDSDVIPDTGRTTTLTLDPGQNATGWDAGFVKAVVLGGMVWEDIDGNGVQNADDAGLSGIALRLLSADDVVIATTATGDDGFYLFDSNDSGKKLLPGQYRIDLDSAVTDYVITALYSGEDQQQVGELFTVTSGEENRTLNIGLRRKESPTEEINIFLPQVDR